MIVSSDDHRSRVLIEDLEPPGVVWRAMAKIALALTVDASPSMADGLAHPRRLTRSAGPYRDQNTWC